MLVEFWQEFDRTQKRRVLDLITELLKEVGDWD